MKPDFLRHVVNPIIDKYIKPGKLSLKDAIEAKKLVFVAEEKYRFSVYDGDPANLVAYFKSEEFKAFANLLESRNARDVLVEILEEVKKSYSDVHGLVSTVEQVMNLLEGESSKRSSSLETSDALNLNLEKITKTLKDKFSADVSTTTNSVYAKLDNLLEVEVGVFKHHIKLVLKINRKINKQTFEALLEKVSGFAKEIANI